MGSLCSWIAIEHITRRTSAAGGHAPALRDSTTTGFEVEFTSTTNHCGNFIKVKHAGHVARRQRYEHARPQTIRTAWHLVFKRERRSHRVVAAERAYSVRVVADTLFVQNAPSQIPISLCIAASTPLGGSLGASPSLTASRAAFVPPNRCTGANLAACPNLGRALNGCDKKGDAFQRESRCASSTNREEFLRDQLVTKGHIRAPPRVIRTADTNTKQKWGTERYWKRELFTPTVPWVASQEDHNG
ncbi:unnamed protein product, partial [Iphiclides podalirius]